MNMTRSMLQRPFPVKDRVRVLYVSPLDRTPRRPPPAVIAKLVFVSDGPGGLPPGSTWARWALLTTLSRIAWSQVPPRRCMTVGYDRSPRARVS